MTPTLKGLVALVVLLFVLGIAGCCCLGWWLARPLIRSTTESTPTRRRRP